MQYHSYKTQLNKSSKMTSSTARMSHLKVHQKDCKELCMPSSCCCRNKQINDQIIPMHHRAELPRFGGPILFEVVFFFIIGHQKSKTWLAYVKSFNLETTYLLQIFCTLHKKIRYDEKSSVLQCLLQCITSVRFYCMNSIRLSSYNLDPALQRSRETS